MNKIIINRGSFKLDEVVFEQGTTTIGRASSNTISLDDTAVSSHHAKIVTLFHTSYIEDLNSTNGTLVNGKTIHKHSLHSGDVIAVGNHQLLFQSDYNAYKDAENSETVMLKGSEIKKKLSEFIQAHSELSQQHPTANKPQSNTPGLAQNAVSQSSAKSDVSAHKPPPMPAFAPSPNAPSSLDKEKNKAWLEAKSRSAPKSDPAMKTHTGGATPAAVTPAHPKPAPADRPATPLTDEQLSGDRPQGDRPSAALQSTGLRSTELRRTELPSTERPDTERSSAGQPTIDRQAAAQAIRNTATAIKASMRQSTDDTPGIASTTGDVKEANATDTTSVDDAAPASSQKISDMAAAAWIATQKGRQRDSNYAASGDMAVFHRTKSRGTKFMPMIWMLIVAVLIAEVIYITYRSVG